MTKVPINCKSCRKSKSDNNDSLILHCRCKNTKNWLCPKESIPEWCEEKRRSIEDKINGSHQFNCKKCGKLIKFSEILPHKKECSPDEFKEHQSNAGKIGGKRAHEIHPNLGKEQWKKYLSQLKGKKHPMFGKKHKPESKKLQRQAKLGKHPSKETIEKNRIASSGSNNPMYGVHLIVSQETRDKHSKSSKGIPKSEDHKNKIGKANKGKEHPWCEGKLNINWNGGSSYAPYCPKFNKKFKFSIRKRDNHTCQLCGKLEEQEKLDYDRLLSVHHIHYDKQNCYPDCISLCNSCNLKVNYNRDFYEELFTFILWIRNLLYWKNENGEK